MDPYLITAIMIIIVLFRNNCNYSKRLKYEKITMRNYHMLKKVNDELKLENNILKVRISQNNISIDKLNKLNTNIVKKHNELRESIITIPLGSGRYFSIRLSNNHVIKNFSEN